MYILYEIYYTAHSSLNYVIPHDDVIKWKHFPRYWPFVRGIHRPRWIPAQRPVTRRFDVFFDLRLNKRLSKQNRHAGDLRRHRTHYDVIVMVVGLFILHLIITWTNADLLIHVFASATHKWNREMYQTIET